MELTGRRFGHIRVTGVVGQGGMGDVYAAFDEKLERKVALKVLHAEQRLDDEARERLLREARALSKLEHPNICRIHDYIESADVDLLVLEYIDGRTLHDALTEPMTRGEKLRIAVAIAEVLITAHRAGIVHRDLKPENVMLTRSGEVKVLDFGLARWLNRSRVRSSDRIAAAGNVVAHVRHDKHATAAGITLGTPLYMSPEQARGETLTPASDMFSFGLLLQRLFTGKEPHPDELMPREVILRVARGITEPVEGAARDVTALIQRLKQLAPADRPTAVEAVERLRFLEEKPRRIVRRAIAATLALIALLGAWRYTVDLKAERTIAIAARAEADLRRGQAEDLIEFMLGDLRKKLEPVGRLDVLDDVAERALAYTGATRPEVLSTDELVQNARALHQLAQVRIAQGRLDAAFDSANRALQLTQVAAKRPDGAKGDVQFVLAAGHFWVGNVRRLRTEYAAAFQEWQQYRDISVRLANANPANDQYQLERAYAHNAVATLLEAQGDYSGALAQHAPTVSLYRARVAADPASADKRTELAYALNKTGNVLQSLGRLEEARQHFVDEHAIYAGLVQRDPRQRKWQDRLANSHSYLASLYEQTGNAEEAMRHRRAEVDVYRQLHEHDPSNANWKRNYALATMRVADLLRPSSPHSALELFALSERLLGEVVAADLTRPTWQRDLAVVKTVHARALIAAGKVSAATTLVREAESSLLRLSSADPVNSRALADSQIVLGESFAAAGQPARAAEAWDHAVATIAATAQRTSEPIILDTWARALIRAGRVADAQPVVARLHRSGYRHADLENLLVRVQSGRG